MTPTYDPGDDLAAVSSATARLLATASKLDDESLRRPSLCPGWSRGHVLTHLARNADSLVNLLTWARTGVVTPQYPSAQARVRDIEAGATRPVAEILADLETSAARLAQAAAAMPTQRWETQVRPLNAPARPARALLSRRLREVEVHHVDLDAGYGPADWPDSFVLEQLTELTTRLSNHPEAPTVAIVATDRPARFVLGRADTVAPVVRGPAAWLLAWVLGRGTGENLRVEPAGALPVLPAWS